MPESNLEIPSRKLQLDHLLETAWRLAHEFSKLNKMDTLTCTKDFQLQVMITAGVQKQPEKAYDALQKIYTNLRKKGLGDLSF